MSINQKQNEASQIEMLAAQRQLYSSAKVVIGLQMILAGPIAAVATLFGIINPELKNSSALLGVTILALDLTLLNPCQKRLRSQGALVQEAFDTKVLSIEWNEIKVGKRPEPELIHEYAQKFGLEAYKLKKLYDWYPSEVHQLPMHWGRIVCQRANIWWDSKLRRRYANTVLSILILIAVFFVWFAFSQNLSMTDFLVMIVIPMSALYKLGASQFVEHRDAADRLDKLREYAEKLWKSAINGAGFEEMKVNSRMLQDEIYDGRKKNPPIFDTIFWMFRNAHEEQMNKGASVLIQEARVSSKAIIQRK